MKQLPLLLFCLSAGVPLFGQTLEPFPAGEVGVNYDAVRIDLLGECFLEIDVDGVLDETAWELAPFHPLNEHWKGGRTPCFADPNAPTCVDAENFWPTIAAVADAEFLFVAWRVIDPTRVADDGGGCGGFHDDSLFWHDVPRLGGVPKTIHRSFDPSNERRRGLRCIASDESLDFADVIPGLACPNDPTSRHRGARS